MAITNVTLLVEDRSARESQQEQNTLDEFTDLYLVETNDSSHSQQYIKVNAAVPKVGDANPFHPGSLVYDRDVDRAPGSSLHWFIRVYYTSDLNRFQGSNYGPPVVRTITTRQVPDTLRRDRQDNKAVTNSAGIPYPADAAVISRSLMVVTYTRREPTFDENVIYNYVDHVNSGVFKNRGENQVLCEAIGATENPIVTEQNVIVPNWDVSYTFVVEPLGWFYRPIDEGLQQNVAGTFFGIYVDDVKVTEPWPLDGTGLALTQGQIAAGNIVVLEFAKYPQANFNDFGL